MCKAVSHEWYGAFVDNISYMVNIRYLCGVYYAKENFIWMDYALEKNDKYILLTINEKNLNTANAAELKSLLVYLFQDPQRYLVIDLGAVEYIDSSGLSAILTGYRLWRERGGMFLIGVEAEPVRRLIEISKLDDVLTIVPDLDTALAEMVESDDA